MLFPNSKSIHAQADSNSNEVIEQTESQILKFDPGFYEIILQKMENNTNQPQPSGTLYHTVIILANKTNPQTLLSDEAIREENKDTIVELLQSRGAIDIYRADELSFVMAKLPIDNIIELASYDAITNIGDVENEPEPLVVGPLIKFAIDIVLSNLVAHVHENVDPTVAIKNIHRYMGYNFDPDLTGSGVAVAIFDNGMDGAFMGSNTYHVDCFSSATCTTSTTSNTQTQPNSPPNYVNHGTTIARIISSDQPVYHGIAKDASIYSVKIINPLMTSNVPDHNLIVKGLDWAVSNDIDIVNFSLGLQSDCVGDRSLSLLFDEIVQSGTVVIAKAGTFEQNSYPRANLPGCVQNVLTVGSYNRFINLGNEFDDMPTDTSDRWPTFSMDDNIIIKPDIVAPDTTVTSDGISVLKDLSTDYASAYVSGLTALILQRQPNYTPAQVKAAW